MDGLLLVDKPVDWSSFDVVAKVRGAVNSGDNSKSKIGHTGTLDPKASGLLILVIGNYTKRAEQYSKLDKVYRVEMTLGATSSTGDIEGKIVEQSDYQPGKPEILEIFNKFSGKSQQIPPAYSAIKVNGQRAYKLARSGKIPELKAREVNIYSFELLSYKYPAIDFRIKVSSGTYIRSLVEDIGKSLKTGAYTKNLRRETVGKFSIEGSISVEQLTWTQVSKNIRLG